MLEMGILVALGFLVMLAKLPWRSKLWVLSHPLLMDAITFILLRVIHWGTFSGVMVASIGALFCSLMLAAGRRFVGYYDAGRYVRGFFDVSRKLA